MKTWTILLILIIAAIAFSQPPETLWMRTYGWNGQYYGYAVQPGWGGGFITAGYANINGALADFFCCAIR